ncbi:hypothetical protein BDV3_003719 [Batrachochytrium dendrobatidis]|nr:hypothetical protein QVD99_004023 [Batrachochytrium dendrobatidis]
MIYTTLLKVLFAFKVLNAVILVAILGTALVRGEISLWAYSSLTLHLSLLVGLICYDIKKQFSITMNLFSKYECVLGFINFLYSACAYYMMESTKDPHSNSQSLVLRWTLLIDVAGGIIFWTTGLSFGLLIIIVVYLDEAELDYCEETISQPLAKTGKQLEVFLFELPGDTDDKMFASIQPSTTDAALQKLPLIMEDSESTFSTTPCCENTQTNDPYCLKSCHVGSMDVLPIAIQRRPSLTEACTKYQGSNLWSRRFSLTKQPRILRVPIDDALCTICLGSYSLGDRLHRLDCSHHFHAACIKSWLNVRNLCPLCNSAVVGVDIDLNEDEIAEFEKYTGEVDALDDSEAQPWQSHSVSVSMSE